MRKAPRASILPGNRKAPGRRRKIQVSDIRFKKDLKLKATAARLLVDMDERRRFHRISSQFSLEVHPSESGEGTSQNVSATGLLFSQKSPSPIGTTLYLTIRQPGLSGDVSVKGRVVRCEPIGSQFQIAVQFVDVDKETEDSILDLVKESG